MPVFMGSSKKPYDMNPYDLTSRLKMQPKRHLQPGTWADCHLDIVVPDINPTDWDNIEVIGLVIIRPAPMNHTINCRLLLPIKPLMLNLTFMYIFDETETFSESSHRPSLETQA